MSLLARLVAGLVLVAGAVNLYLYQYPLLYGEVCSWHDDASIRLLAFGDPQITGTTQSTSWRKRLDVVGNDFFLGHIYSVLTSKLQPSHVAVMGDLFSSQWIRDDEFSRRAHRYKTRIFTVDDSTPWELVNITGNHDIGYNGEMSADRVSRYEAVFGPVNYARTYSDEQGREWRLVVVNSLAIDGPGYDETFMEDTILFLDHLRENPFDGPTVLLTHVPLDKVDGICRDGTMFEYYPWGNLREQNHLSRESSNLLLDSVFAGSSSGIILTGHDHEGCVAHYSYDPEEGWTAGPGPVSEGVSDKRQITEVTVRSMMGEYGGNGGLVSGIWRDGRAEFVYTLCSFGPQHTWWAGKILAYVAATAVSVFSVYSFM